MNGNQKRRKIKLFIIIGGAVVLVAAVALVLTLVLSGNDALTYGITKDMTMDQITEALQKQGLATIPSWSGNDYSVYTGAKVLGFSSPALYVEPKSGLAQQCVIFSYNFCTKEYADSYFEDAAASAVASASEADLKSTFDNLKKSLEGKFGSPAENQYNEIIWEKNGNVYWLNTGDGSQYFSLDIYIGCGSLNKLLEN